MPWNIGLIVERVGILCTYLAQTLRPPEISSAQSWDNLVNAGGEYIILNEGGAIGHSADGITWSFTSSASVGVPIASNGLRYVTSTRSGSEIIRSSDDFGATWTNRLTISTGFQIVSLFNLNGPVFALVSNGSGFVLVGGTTGGNTTNPNVFYSTDGATWTGVHVGTGTAPTFSSVRALGGDYYMSGTLSGNNLFYKSVDDGASWTSLPVPLGPAWMFPVLYVGDGRVVMSTRSTSDTTPNRLWSTINDGSTWTEHTVPSGLRDILYMGHDGVRWVMTLITTGGLNRTAWATSLDGPWTFLGFAGDQYNTDYLLATSTVYTNFVTTEFDTVNIDDTLSIWQTDLDCAPTEG
jgi:hypothetical protein